MNKIKLLFAFATLIFIGSCTYVYLAYVELNKLAQYDKRVRIMGHEVIELRDEIISASIQGISEPYQVTNQLVNLERELQQFHQQHQATALHSTWFKHLPTEALLNDFHTSATSLIKMLDQTIGLIVAREFVLHSLKNKLANEGEFDTNNQPLDQLLTYLLDENVIAADEEVARFTRTFIQLNTQRENLLSKLLSHDSIKFLEQTEFGLTTTSTQLRNTISQVLIGIALLFSALATLGFIARIAELNRNNLAYQVATENAEKANEAKSIFLATMSHELRTPMNGVLGIAQIIKDESQELETKKQAQILIDSGQHLLTILNDILDFSKVEQGKLELEIHPFSIGELILSLEKTLGSQAINKGLQFVIRNQIPPNIELHGDLSRTRQILFNLVGNAIKFTHTGKVEIEFSLDNETPANVCIRVTDSGIGIEDDKLDAIFTPFEQAELSTTRQFGGTGLGLSIVKRLVEMMGGEVSVSSQVNVGTQFSLVIPFEVKELEINEEEAPAPSNDIRLDNFTILLVEDNRVNAMVAKKFCESMGLLVDHANDGLEAISRLKHSHYDLIIMDNHMPNMNGLDAIEHIRTKLKLNTVIFACTADVFKEAHDEFIRRGANFVLTKPLQKSSLQNAIHQFLQDFISHREVADALKHLPQDTSHKVSTLVRTSVDKLPLTEEEVSQSPLFNQLELQDIEKIELLESLIFELDTKTDSLIDTHSNATPTELHAILHAIKGIALEFSMGEVLVLTKQAEDMARQGEIPELELLQKLVNRLMVNRHEASRLIARLRPHNKTG
ncbi:ATP-binding protein [Vibrio sp. Isolate25]|uniref:ATP-binding protein n=1 Tax=Vibrio TaxID=662 RepID=UPI001EFDCE94|nr:MULTISPECIES: ATP-binding protein [Vibrio]MCG9597699.1 ATP-binding protein [Vibrio sp. Isolate25]USD31429.1 response regulator [Vibrio sp. SCSIO 43186]USD44473.1 response regulator [Vibrio sp. SCSIO 43145]USD68552.1 response regulator [Vibrio sp. SCSIO 43139]USD96242.1 hybrid sensor histidine kinase/response regulator [Vibrio coralliilyticus]